MFDKLASMVPSLDKVIPVIAAVIHDH
jgi:hypothetical protein